MKLAILIIVIILLIVYNWYVENNLINGVWSVSPEFAENNDIDDFIMYIDGYGRKTVRLVLTRGDEVITADGLMTFVYTNPFSYIFPLNSSGKVFVSGCDDVFSKRMTFSIDIFKGILKFTGEKNYGEFYRAL